MSGNRRRSPRLRASLGICLLIAWTTAIETPARDLAELSILQDSYPRVFFFRASEQACSARRYPSYQSWDQQFSRLQGIIGKCLDEECIGREPRNIEFFSRFKDQHPDQVVLLHFNGNARDPRYHTETYFPGHWIYRAAVTITRDVPAQAGESVIHVEDTRGFRINAGRYKTSNDDIALLGITPDGKHDWQHCEQVQLLAVDHRASVIHVKRGCYGTTPLSFKANHSRAAPHQVEGPWGRNNNIMWYYNFSALCPRDTNGRTCADLLVEDLAEWFGPSGKLAAFDGIEFDVMFNQTHGDTNGDGHEDNGMIDGINQYGIGVVQFARAFRQRMGNSFIIQGDGALGPGGSRSQRAWGILNGIESEGWPNLSDPEIDDWSGALNRHYFWRDNARPPVFNYVNHKWTRPVQGQPGVRAHADVPFSRHRLVFAACQFFDAAICYSFAPPNDADGKFGIWDEFRCGTENQPGWLGHPEGPAIHLARAQPDLLKGRGCGRPLAKRITGAVKTTVTERGIRIESATANSHDLHFTIKDIPTNGPDLFVAITMQGHPRAKYPSEMARFAQVGASGGMIDLLAGQPTALGLKLRNAEHETEFDASTGAMFQFRPTTLGGETLPSYFVHPPYRRAPGYTYWEREVNVPQNSVLSFAIGMGEKSPKRSDGVRFEIYAAVVTDGVPGDYTKLFEATTNRNQWLRHQVPLARFGAKRVRLKFVADCGPQNNATTDHAYWGIVRIMSAQGDADHITELKQFMTWINDRPFQSSFYYQHINSNKVDLTVHVEGHEPVVIHSISAHAHPDAMYRVFEQGIVLANPARKPCVFDLNALSPGRSYRRFQATDNQDRQTNNGRAVGPTVVLGDRDALFLMRSDQ